MERSSGPVCACVRWAGAASGERCTGATVRLIQSMDQWPKGCLTHGTAPSRHSASSTSGCRPAIMSATGPTCSPASAFDTMTDPKWELPCSLPHLIATASFIGTLSIIEAVRLSQILSQMGDWHWRPGNYSAAQLCMFILRASCHETPDVRLLASAATQLSDGQYRLGPCGQGQPACRQRLHACVRSARMRRWHTRYSCTSGCSKPPRMTVARAYRGGSPAALLPLPSSQASASALGIGNTST